MKINKYIILLLLPLLSIFALGFGCSSSKPTPDPLAGFHVSDLRNLDSNKAIVDDYKGYVQKLPSEQKKNAYLKRFYEDGIGQHAVQIEIPLNGIWWEHVLIYDKKNTRTKTIKYSGGDYHS